MEQVPGDRLASEARQAAVKALARDLGMPLEQVEHVYAEEASRIESVARIKTFVPVVVANRVRAQLRQQRNR